MMLWGRDPSRTYAPRAPVFLEHRPPTFARQRRKRQTARLCKHCGKPYVAVRNPNTQETCSRRCGTLRSWAKRREENAKKAGAR